MAQTARRARTKPSSTTQKSSTKPTEKPQSDSQASEKESDETSTQTESSSSSSSDDENEALFDEADEKAQKAAESDEEADEDSEPDDEPESAQEAAQDLPEGDEVTFEVPEREYSFKGIVSGNRILVTEDVTREITLPGSSKKGTVLAHNRGQVLPLGPWEQYTKKSTKE